MSYTLTPKSQVTLPKQIREFLKVAPGDAVDFQICADGTVRVLPVRVAARSETAPEVDWHARYRALQGTAGSGKSTAEWMNMLRGYDEDDKDPGFAKPST